MQVRKVNFFNLVSLFVLVLTFSNKAIAVSDHPVHCTDSGGHQIILDHPPRRIVSLVPAATEVIFALDSQSALVGVTYHDTHPAEIHTRTIVGGFFKPSVSRIEDLNPDVILLSQLHKEVREHFHATGAILVEVDSRTVEQAYQTIKLIGTIVQKPGAAQAIIREIEDRFETLRLKVAGVDQDQRKRVMRLMGRSSVMTPGDDSFQNQLIRAAGCIPPHLGKKGAVVHMTEKEWKSFDPQVVYYCGTEEHLLTMLRTEDGWNDVEAVRNDRFIKFPCPLTCRASVNMAYFASRLAARVYGKTLSCESNNIEPDSVVRIQELDIDLDTVSRATIVSSSIGDFPHQTLLIEFAEPTRSLSSLEGRAPSARWVANHHLPPPAWNMAHERPLDELKALVCGVLDSPAKQTSMLYTGARMDHLSVQKQSFQDMTVYAFITSGVRSNAIRAGLDTGMFYEPGTINVIIVTNMGLTDRAMTRAIITVTEAKTAALQDLDIRSSVAPYAPATGTGTDNVVIVSGAGQELDNAGGHSKLGELIAKAVYPGVRESIARQNGIVPDRSVFRRMHERHLSVFELVRACNAIDATDQSHVSAKLEALLLNPEYSGFIESAFVLSDAYAKGLIHDVSQFERLCARMSLEGTSTIEGLCTPILPETMAPPLIRRAFEALICRALGQLDSRSGAMTRNGTCGSGLHALHEVIRASREGR